MKIRTAVIVALLALPAPLVSQAGRLAGGLSAMVTQHPTIASWGTEQGLPSNIVLSIAQTRDGFLWLASYQGLVRFDGVKFRAFTETDIPGLARAAFWKAVVDGSGALWAATENAGVVRLDDRGWLSLTTRDGLPSDRVTAMIVDRAGTVWLGSHGQVSRIVDGRVELLPPLPPSTAGGRRAAPERLRPEDAGGNERAIGALAVGTDGTLWIGTVADGLLRYRDGAYSQITEADGLGDDRITSLHADDAGVLWVGSYGSGLTRIHGDTIARVATDGPAVPQRVNDIVTRDDGTLWLAADNGIFRMDGGRALPVRQRNGDHIQQAEALQEDIEGSLWIGSRQSGLFRLREASARTIGTADGLPDDLVYAVAGDGAGGEWVATQGGVAHRTGGGTTVHTRATGALADDISRDVMLDRAGNVWVATNGGLTRLQLAAGGSVRARTFTTRDGLVDDRARALAEGRDGTLWIGTLNGLASLRDGVFRDFGPADGLTDVYILSVFEDSRGTLWVGTQTAGLFRRTASGFVPGPPPLVDQPVFRITESADGTLWIGSARGLGRLRGDSLRMFTARDGLPGNAFFQALDDGGGHLWLTGPWGIARVARDELAGVADGRLAAVTAKQFGRADGMPAHDASSISRAWIGPTGVLHFPTPAGLGLLDPRLVEPNTVPPPTHVEKVLVDGVAVGGEMVKDGQSIAVGPGTRKLELRFTAPSFVAPALLRFRYRLEPFDEDWVDGGTQRVAHYTSLRPGRYSFRVQARNEDGVWSDHAAAVELHLRPYFWQTWWFGVLVALSLVVLAALAHRLRVRAVARRVREETLREASLRDELTGLYNRRGLLELADHQMLLGERERRGFTLIFVDMDGMKRINDTFGHQRGDQAIADAAAQLRSTFRASDVIGRLGGDEFVVIVPDHPEGAAAEGGGDVATDVQSACDRLAEAVAHHNATANRPYRLSLSVGASRFEPGSPVSIEVLLDSADREMYAQKRVKSGGAA